MERLFDKVLVCPPGENYPNCLSTHPDRGTINLDLAGRQHDEYVRVLGSQRIDVEVVAQQNSLPDSVFIQDPAIIGRNIVLIGRFREPSRQRETELIAKHLEKSGRTIIHVSAKATLEGGDILVAEDTIFVGVTGRTNLQGFSEVQRAFPETQVKSVKFSSEFFHLLSACSYLADKQLLICERYVDPLAFDDFERLSVAHEDVVAVNVLPLGRGKILMPSGYNRVWNLLTESGYDPIEIDNSEFVKGDGRITCSCSPFYNNLD